MSSADPVLLITSAITASAARTAVGDADVRLQATVEALRHWRRMVSPARIVICDGSNFDFEGSEFAAEFEGFELLRFQNELPSVIRYGKGWGEGAIVAHALLHSQRLKRAECFAKCTSKLWVENFGALPRSVASDFAFDFYGGWHPVRLDTRFYMAKVQAFKAHLMQAYVRVDEPAGLDLETVYAQALAALPLSQYVAPWSPAIGGLSGSMGSHYAAQLNRARLKGWRNRLIRLKSAIRWL